MQKDGHKVKKWSMLYSLTRHLVHTSWRSGDWELSLGMAMFPLIGYQLIIFFFVTQTQERWIRGLFGCELEAL